MAPDSRSHSIVLFRAWLVRCSQDRGEPYEQFADRHPQERVELDLLRVLMEIQRRGSGARAPIPTAGEFLAWLREGASGLGG